MIIKFYFLFTCIVVTSFFSHQQENLKQHNRDGVAITFLTFNLQFDEALKILDKSTKEEPNSLQWKYYHAMVLFRKGENIANYISVLNKKEAKTADSILEQSYNELVNVAHLGEKIIESNPNDTLALFFTGAAYGYIGMYHADKNEYFKAASEGKKGIEYYEKLIEKCPQWNDVYYSRAVFNFYTSAVPWYFKPILWILGKMGTESQAELYLKKVADWGSIAKYAATEKLVQLYLRQEKYDLAVKLNDELINKFPQTKYKYLLTVGWALANRNEYSHCLNIFKQGYELSKLEHNVDSINRIEISYMYTGLAKTFELTGDLHGSLQIYKEFLERKLDSSFDPWVYYEMANLYSKLGMKNEETDCYTWIKLNSKNDYYKKIAIQKLGNK